MRAPGPVSAGVQAPIPFKHEAASGGAGVGASALAVLLVLLAAVCAVLYLRKRLNLPLPGAGGRRLVRVLQSERMGPRALLSVVEFGGQRYLLVQGEHGISCVASAPAPADGKDSA
jgi:flagellar biogenesis protein FliO